MAALPHPIEKLVGQDAFERALTELAKFRQNLGEDQTADAVALVRAGREELEFHEDR